MLSHDLTEAVVRAPNTTNPIVETIDVWVFTVSAAGGHGRHRADGQAKVAEAYGCEVRLFDNDSTNAGRAVHMVGTRGDLEALLRPTVAAMAETAAATATRQQRRHLTTNG
jgi:hypothetical protein